LEEMKIDMPDEFPAVEFTDFMARVRAIMLPEKGPEWTELASASNLVAYRFRSTAEAFESFARSWEQHGAGGADHNELYLRERAFFIMFASGLSCLEATCYGIQAVASHKKVLHFAFGEDEQRSSSPDSLRKALRGFDQAAPLRKTIKRMMRAREWRVYTQLRNRMAHRSVLPRLIKLSEGAVAPAKQRFEAIKTTSSDAVSLSLDDLRTLILWLADALRGLLVGATALIPIAPPSP